MAGINVCGYQCNRCPCPVAAVLWQRAKSLSVCLIEVSLKMVLIDEIVVYKLINDVVEKLQFLSIFNS